MKVNKIISLTEARKQIFDLAEEVQTRGVHVVLTEYGKSKAVLLSADEFDEWQKTLDCYKREPKLYQRLAEAKKQAKMGRYLSLEDELKKEGYIVSDSAKRKYTYDPHRSKRKSKN